MIRAHLLRTALAAGALASVAPLASAQTTSGPSSTDPRVGLKPGWYDAGVAASGMSLIGHVNPPNGFTDPKNPGAFPYAQADMAFKSHYVVQGTFHGFEIWDVSNPASPKITVAYACPGGQGDPSIYRNLLFISVEELVGRTDCGNAPPIAYIGGSAGADSVNAGRFRGVRIFDISDIAHPRQVGAVQTCRGSHTHTLVPDPRDPNTVYIYVSGTSRVRPAAELAGCSGAQPNVDPNTSLFRIEVIKVPVMHPEQARIVSTPRVFADSTGNIAGLWAGGAHGDSTQSTARTDQCHDITVYEAIGLAAGACSGNGLLLDISDPVNPKRVAAVMDPNFAYWHSATFNNAGTKVLFSDEWGGGMAPRCRSTDRPNWGADAIFTLSGHTLTEAGYYKLPVAQTETENCVAHDGMLLPVPGRDIMIQAWYQGGISVFDWTDPAHPQEIAYFDRGPMDPNKLLLGGFWSAYWYNGHIYGSDIDRGLDIFDLKPSDKLSQNEIDAAKLVHMDVLNPQTQQRIVWPASFVVARAYLDQLNRSKGLANSATYASALDHAEKLRGGARKAALVALAAQLDGSVSSSSDGDRVKMMVSAVRDLANATR